MKHRHRLLAPFVGGIAALGLIAGCGDDSEISEETDPQEVLASAFGSDEQSVDSGVIDLTVAVTASGGDEPGDIALSFGGPFQSNGEGELPSFDFDVSADLEIPEQEGSYSFGAAVTEGSGFINYNGTEYLLDDATFEQLSSGFAQSSEATEEQGAGASLAELGLDPSSWLTDVSNEGVEDVEGAEAVHISGAADVEAIFADIAELATSQPIPVEGLPSAEEIAEIAAVVDTAEIDVYTGTEDGILRRLEVVLALANPDDPAESFAFDLDLTLSELNEDQEISAPDDAEPIADLLGQFGGLGGLGGVPAPGGEVPEVPDLGGGIPDSADVATCVEAAGSDPEAIQACFQ